MTAEAHTLVGHGDSTAGTPSVKCSCGAVRTLNTGADHFGFSMSQPRAFLLAAANTPRLGPLAF